MFYGGRQSKEPERTVLGEGNHSSDASQAFSRYFLSSGSRLQEETNKVFYFLVGAGLFFILLSIPIARFALGPGYSWLLCLPGVLVIILAFMRDRKLLSRGATYRASAEEQEQYPPPSPTLQSSLDEDSEIDMYWGYRPTAHKEMRHSLLKCEKQLFISGIGLNTIVEELCDPHVLDSLAQRFCESVDFKIVIVMLLKLDHVRRMEQGGLKLEERIGRGRALLLLFVDELSSRLPNHEINSIVEVKTYNENVIPRHFFLRADAAIYIGSYLSHREGSFSYLMKLRDTKGGLYQLFANEIDFLLANTHTVDIRVKD